MCFYHGSLYMLIISLYDMNYSGYKSAFIFNLEDNKFDSGDGFEV